MSSPSASLDLPYSSAREFCTVNCQQDLEQDEREIIERLETLQASINEHCKQSCYTHEVEPQVHIAREWQLLEIREYLESRIKEAEALFATIDSARLFQSEPDELGALKTDYLAWIELTKTLEQRVHTQRERLQATLKAVDQLDSRIANATYMHFVASIPISLINTALGITSTLGSIYVTIKKARAFVIHNKVYSYAEERLRELE